MLAAAGPHRRNPAGDSRGIGMHQRRLRRRATETHNRGQLRTAHRAKAQQPGPIPPHGRPHNMAQSRLIRLMGAAVSAHDDILARGEAGCGCASASAASTTGRGNRPVNVPQFSGVKHVCNKTCFSSSPNARSSAAGRPNLSPPSPPAVLRKLRSAGRERLPVQPCDHPTQRDDRATTDRCGMAPSQQDGSYRTPQPPHHGH